VERESRYAEKKRFLGLRVLNLRVKWGGGVWLTFWVVPVFIKWYAFLQTAKSETKTITNQSMNIQQLKSIWNSEKEVFKEKELGALQNFVRKVLECVELFNLEEGKESTAPHYRQNVFIQEDTDNIARNRPDFVLYLEIDQTQIKIPVEVEKHENIKAGEKQIKDYRELYNAVYAILTDGYEWRFYDGDTVDLTPFIVPLHIRVSSVN